MTPDTAELDGDIAEPTNILLVDDLPEKLLVFETVLAELGQNVISVHSGSDALREVLKREFAVILLDVNMPDIDGFETAELIRKYKKSAHTPIIFITAYADEMQTARGYSLGAVDYILSPVVPEVLRSKVRVFVELHTLQRRLRRQADERVALAAAEAARRAAEEATRRSAFLSHASRVLGDSLDVQVGMQRLLALIVPRIAPTARVLVEGPSQPFALTLACQRGHGAAGEGGEVAWDETPFDALPAALQATLRRGMASVAPIVAETAPNGVETVLPLLSGERIVGSLWVRTDAQAPDATLLAALASRAGVGFENAGLFQSRQLEIEERRAAEARLRAAGERKDEFLAMLAHELRNPLAPIRNALEIIRRIAPPDPKLVWATDVTGRQVDHLTRLVEELLDVARISQGKIALKTETLDLRNPVAHAIETTRPFIDKLHHQLIEELPDAPVWLRGDAARLSQVVANLLHNAAKYTEEGGTVRVSLTVDGGQAVVAVRDNGMGIEPELLPDVFELFAQGKRSLDRSQGGLGVGLTLVRRLVELHQGKVTVASEGAGRGAEFRVALPCLQQVDGPSGAAPDDASGPSRAGCRVLVVDDNHDAAESTAAVLEMSGHVVQSVHDGLQAVPCAIAFEPDVVLLDIGLPTIDGYEVARRLRKLPQAQHALLIALTGYGQEADRLRAVEAGFDHHLVKPADPAQLLRLIEQGMAAGAARAAAPAAGQGE